MNTSPFSINPGPCPFTWKSWEWWLGIQVDLVCVEIMAEVAHSRFQAMKEMHSALNKAQLDILANSGRRVVWKEHRSLL